MRKETEAWQPHFLSLAAGLVFFVSLFFYLSYVNPEYDGSYFSGGNPLIRETLVPGGLAVAAFLIFASEYLASGYLRDGLSIGGLLLECAFVAVAITDYFLDKGKMSDAAASVREVAMVILLVLTLLPLLLAFVRFGRPSFFGQEDPWRELPLDVLAMSFASFFCALVLLIRMRDEIDKATLAFEKAGKSIEGQAGVPLFAEVFAIIVLAYDALILLYCLYLFQSNKRDPSKFCRVLSYVGVIGAFLPLVALYGVFSYYTDKVSGSKTSYYGTSYQMMYYTVMMSVPQIAISLGEAIYFFYRNRLLSGD
jgi:hypothetical protein